jgi:hypothetical protein
MHVHIIPQSTKTCLGDCAWARLTQAVLLGIATSGHLRAAYTQDDGTQFFYKEYVFK